MKVTISPQIKPRRGCEPKIGNVYQNPHGRPFYKMVVGIVDRTGRGLSWNNIVMLHIDAKGNIVGSSCSPQAYIRDHHDLMGFVKDMPNMQIEWFRETDASVS